VAPGLKLPGGQKVLVSWQYPESV